MNLQDVLTALRNADAAGDVAAARRLAQIAQSLQSQSSQYDTQIQDIDQRIAAIRGQKVEPKTTIGGNVKELFKGVIPGAVGLVETAGTGISALLPDDTERAAREKIKEIAGVVKKPFEAAPGYEDSIGRKLGEGLGSFLPVAPLGLLGAPGIAAGVGVGVAAGAGEARERAERGSATADQRGTATALGTIPGAFDTAIDMALAAFPGGAGKAVGFIKRAFMSGGIEGATEAAQEVAQNAIAKGVYKPGQELLEGSGEAGATGAGVGVLASLILDMAIPGRRRGAAPTTQPPTAPPEAPPAETLALPRPTFTSDEITAAREQDKKTSDPMARFDETSQKIARRGKEAALAETFAQEPPKGQMDLPGVERADGTVEIPGRGRVTPEAAATEPAVAEPERETQTRDMIDELEIADISRMVEEDKSAELRSLLQEDPAKAEKDRLKFESDLAELDGRLKAKQEKTTQDKRLEVLLPLIDSNVTNIPQVFARELKREGFADTNLTERERLLLEAAYNFRVAERPEPTQPEVEPSAPAENAAMEALIPEKKEKRQPPGQASFPGMGKPKGAAPQAFSEEELAGQAERDEKPFVTKLTPEALAATGLPKQSGFFKQLLNIDMANEANWPVMRDVLTRVRTNPNVSQNTKDAIERIAMQAFGGLAKQQELFPQGRKPSEPKGGKPSEPKEPKTPKAPKEEKPSGTTGRRTKDAGDVAAGDRTRPEGGEAGSGAKKSDAKPADTKRTEAPKPSGVGDSRKPADGAGEREGTKPGALKKEGTPSKAEQAALQDELDAELGQGKKTEARKPLTAREMLDRAEEAQRKADAEAKARTETKTETKSKAKPTGAARLGRYGQLAETDRDEAIKYLAYDMYIAMFEKFKLLNNVNKLNEITATLRRGEMPEVSFGSASAATSIEPLSGGAYAEAFYNSLSDADRQALIKRMEEYFGKSEAETRRAHEAAISTQYLDIARRRAMQDETTQLLDMRLGEMNRADVATLEAEYKAPRTSEKFLTKLKADILNMVNKGGRSVAKGIRNIVKKLSEGVLAVAMVFNPQFMGTNFSFDLPKTFNQTVTKTTVVKAQVPAAAREKMSPLAQMVYENMAPAAKASGKGFGIVDKPNGAIHFFNKDGSLLVQGPALTGKDAGDVLGKSSLAGGPKITPAGKFTLELSKDDFYGTSFNLVETKESDGFIAIHPVYLGDIKENRIKRLESPEATDNRISYGCINTTKEMFTNALAPNADALNGGMLLVLPDATAKTAEMFPEQTETVTETFTGTEQTARAEGRTMVGREEKLEPVGQSEKAQANSRMALVREAMRMYMPLHPEITAALRGGDVVGALTLMAKRMSGRNAAIASALAKALPGVKIQIVDNLKSSSGRDLSGDYDPATNTIRLDAQSGLNVHTVLHEATHAAVLKVLSNKSHPMTKQLTELFDNIKGSLDSAYGATSLDEFVSEVMSNPEFQQKLAQINPKGEPISALRRFFNAVGNLLRRMVGMQTKGLDSAIDAADVLIGNILTPGGSTLGVGTLYQASLLGTAKGVFGAMDDAILRMPKMDNSFVGGVYDVLRDKIPTATKNIILQSLPLNALTEVAARYIPMAKRLDTLEKEWGGAIDIQRQAVDAAYQHIQRWIKGNPEKEVALNRVIADSTRNEVDPSKPRGEYKGKQTKSNEDKQVIWDRLQADWKALEGEGQAIYNQMRDSYTEAHTRLLNLLFKRIDDSVSDPKEADALRTEIYKRLAVKGKIEPYFPLMRQGDYWVTFHAKGPDGNMEYYKMAFENSVERARAIRELKADPNVDAKSVEESSPTGKRNYKSAPSTSFVNSILKVLNANGVADNVTDEIMRVFLDTLPESSFAQSFRTRLGTLGFETDATKVFYTKSISMAHQLANLEYGAKMYKLRDEMDEHVKAKGNDPAARMVFDTLDRHVQTMVSPNIAQWSKVATSTAFGFTLGFNVSSALVNFTQLPMVVMPYLGGKYGLPETTKAIGAAARLYLGSGLSRRAKMTGSDARIDLKAGYSLDNYNFVGFDDAVAAHTKKTGKVPTATERLQIAAKVGLTEEVLDMRELAEVSGKYGLLSRSVASDTLEMGKDDTVLTRINNWTGFVFHHGERMNRQVAMIAAYKLELDRMREGKRELTTEDRQAAAQEAIRLTELLNGGASANSAPLLAKSSLGKIAFMYKRYGVSMYYMMFKTAREAMKSEDKQVRDAAKRQIAGIYTSAALLAGVQGLPMFGIMAVVYNMFKDDDEDDLETAARKYMGEGYFNGALNYLTGTAVANRIGLTDLLLHSTGYRNQDNAVLSFLQLAGGPVYGVADRMIRGGKMISEGEVQRGLEQVMPAAFGNVMKGYRFGTEGANTLRGDPIVGDIGVGHSLAQAFGFAPAEYTRQLEVNAAEKNTERRVTEERTKLLRQYYVATRMGDSDGASAAMQKLVEMGAKRPGLVTPETIRRSMAQHMRTTSTMYHGITMNKLMRNELLQDAAEYDSDVTIFRDEGE